MKYTSIESLRSKLSPTVKIFIDKPRKTFLWAFEFRKNIFFLKNCKFNSYRDTNFWHKWKKCINRKLKVLAYPESENFNRNPWKTFFTGLWTFEKMYFFTKIVNSTFTGVRIFGTSEKMCTNRKLKVLAYPESENFIGKPWKTFFIDLWT